MDRNQNNTGLISKIRLIYFLIYYIIFKYMWYLFRFKISARRNIKMTYRLLNIEKIIETGYVIMNYI